MIPRVLKIGIIVLISFGMIMPMAAQAEVTEGMTQGAFALWLVKAIGAQGRLSQPPTEEAAIEFMRRLGVVPGEGWDKNGEVTRDFLADLLGEDEAGDLTFDELVDKVRNKVNNLFEDARLGVFPAFATTPTGHATP